MYVNICIHTQANDLLQVLEAWGACSDTKSSLYTARASVLVGKKERHQIHHWASSKGDRIIHFSCKYTGEVKGKDASSTTKETMQQKGDDDLRVLILVKVDGKEMSMAEMRRERGEVLMGQGHMPFFQDQPR